MANVSWSSLEGNFFRIDVGTSKASALSVTDNTILHICTDGAIVMNGETIAERNADLSGYMQKSGGTFTGSVNVGSTSANRNMYVYGLTSLQGNVTIGNATTNKTLKVYGKASTTSDLTVGGSLAATSDRITLKNNGYTVYLYKPTDEYFYLMMSNKNGSTWNDLRPLTINMTNGWMSLASGAMTLVNNGDVTVAHTLTATKLVQTSTSDLRAKENLNADFDALAKLRELGDVYEFDYKSDGKHSYGLIAQNVEQSELKDMVGHVDKDDPDSLRYVNYLDPRITALLIKSVRQLQDEVTKLRSERLKE